jgi:hypothetical protein
VSEIQWTDFSDAMPVRADERASWVGQLLSRNQHVRAGYMMTGDSAVIVFHIGNVTEILEVRVLRTGTRIGPFETTEVEYGKVGAK